MERPATVVAFEGPPLAGKTTQAERLTRRLEADGHAVRLLQRATDECPTRERINELRERTTGFTREAIPAEEETALWAQYYREKNDLILAEARSGAFDYVVADRYFPSLLPVQTPALDATLAELYDRYAEEIERVTPDVLVYLTVDADEAECRYREREGTDMDPSFRRELAAVREQYETLLDRHLDAPVVHRVDTTDRSPAAVGDALVDRVASR